MMVEELTDFGPFLGGVPRAERPHVANFFVVTEPFTFFPRSSFQEIRVTPLGYPPVITGEYEE